MGAYSVDLTELDLTMRALVRAHEELLDVGEQLDGAADLLARHWHGLAATSFDEAQHRWSARLLTATRALQDLRAAAHRAHAAYAEAADANRTAWEALR